MEPQLLLSYNSQSGNGLLGVGWSLSGVPSITRCGRTIGQDGVAGGVGFNGNDRFCLEGERLMVVSGANGANGSKYRTEVESFSNVTAHGQAGSGPAWFEVWSKNGRRLQFGSTTDARVLVQGQPTVRQWKLNRITDTAGNYLTLSYSVEAANGHSYLSRIDYSRHVNKSHGAFNSVRFVYETRPDVLTAYQAGALIKVTKRLKTINAYQGANVVNSYRINYAVSPSTKRSRVTSIQQCAKSGACLPATSFAWNDKPLSFNAKTQVVNDFGVSNGYPNPNHARLLGDLDGNGKPDLLGFKTDGVYRTYDLADGNPSTRISTSIMVKQRPVQPGQSAVNYADAWPNHLPDNTTPRLLGDIDGDGLSDLFAIGRSSIQVISEGAAQIVPPSSSLSEISQPAGTYGIAIQYGLFDISFKLTHSWLGFFPIIFTNPVSGKDHFPRYLADINGDGRSDLVAFRADGMFYTLSTGTGFGPVQTGPTDFASWDDVGAYPRFAMDVNGDGRADLVGMKSDGIYVALSVDNGFAFAQKWLSEFGSSHGWNHTQHIRTFGDVNGDGLPDAVGFKADGVYVALNTGAGFLAPSKWLSEFGNWPSAGNWGNNISLRPRLLADVNGDGRADIVGFGFNKTKVALSTGTGFSASTDWLSDFSAASGQWSNDNYPRQLVDVDGDGLADVVGFGQSGTYVAYNPGGVPDLMTGITTGLGASSTIAYGSLVDPTVHTRSTGSAYPYRDIQFPMQVVTQVGRPDGIGGHYRVAYSYAGAKADLRGWGFLGFASVAARDLQTNIIETNYYRQPFPYTGQTEEKTTKLGTLTLNREQITHQATRLGTTGQRYFVAPSQTVVSSKDLNGAALPGVTTSYQYDGYGNVTRMSVSRSDGSSQTVVNSYTNNTSKWHLGRLTRSTVTNVTP